MKVLVWNIQKFTASKVPINDDHRKRTRVSEMPAIANYLEMVFSGNYRSNNRPDVIALLEVIDNRGTGLGKTPTDDSLATIGLITLQQFMTSLNIRDAVWLIAPPLKCNPPKPPLHPGRWPQEEVVGVLYDSNKVSFEGPNYWVNGASATQLPAVPYDASYPAPWNNAAITGPTARAGRVMFTDSTNNALNFPNQNNRRPFMVDFRERYGARRLVRCAFLHTSPSTCKQATVEIGKISAISDATPDITIVAGDYNVNLRVERDRAAYQELTTRNFNNQLTMLNTYSTHYKKLESATPVVLTRSDKYLVDKSSYQDKYFIDNFYVRVKGGVATNVRVATAIDMVMGVPDPYLRTMEDSLEDLKEISEEDITRGFLLFKDDDNFGHIRATSDHLPIFLNID